MAKGGRMILTLLALALFLASVAAQGAEKPLEDSNDLKPKLPDPKESKPKLPKDPKEKKPKTKYCKDKSFPSCYKIKMTCPTRCPKNCYIDCEICAPVCACNAPGAICEDPKFIGADGVTFFFHGKKEQDFCLVTDRDLHINGHFIGKRSPNMTRDFTWIQSIGILFSGNNNKVHKLHLGALKTSKWEESVDHTTISLDGVPVILPEEDGASWKSPTASSLSIERKDGATNHVTVEVDGKFRITARVVPITEEDSRVHGYGIAGGDDCFAHLEIGFKFFGLTRDVHGVLGQTYRDDYVSRVKMSAAMPIMGGEPKYSSSNLFSTDCAVAKFAVSSAVGGDHAIRQWPDMLCGSRMGGPGTVCKR